ncbi:hypothetical protein [Nitriliruptor alkaliphilus]|uniref:hypothetical protein n=1 Tax=Nitriliruptor alkaliphilus TaxID=427918 RepID=UPI00069852A6|nr:hypothetical protein [Nitriliruptor alkaliphilus]
MRTPAPLRRLDVAAAAVRRRLTSLAIRPGLVALLAGAVLLAGASIHVARFPDRVDADAVARAPADEVGPPPGADLAAYTEARHEHLAQLPADEVVRGIASFRELVAVGDLPVDEEVRVEELHVRLPAELEPRTVPAEGAGAALRALFADGQAELDAAIADLEGLLAEDLGDAEFEREFEAELARLRELRASASDEAPVVFAAVVVASAADLRDLAADPRVRLVDVAGPPEQTRGTRMVGVAPTDLERASTEREVAPDPAP